MMPEKVSALYPFSAIVGQEDMKTALILNLINPSLGGVLIRGEKGTAKSTAVRALTKLMPTLDVVEGCRFNCDPNDLTSLCDDCRDILASGNTLKHAFKPMQVVELPVSATEDRVVGTLDMEYALKTGQKRFESGILAKANRGILYVDEVNLLEDHVVDVLLDSAAMGISTIEREGVSYSHPAKFILVGTMNPEEGDIRPQLIDRFGLSVNVTSEKDIEKRKEVLRLRLSYEADPQAFAQGYKEQEAILSQRIVSAASLLNKVTYSDDILETIAKIAVKLEVDGHRADIALLKTAITLADYENRTEVKLDDIFAASRLTLMHRMRRLPFEEMSFDLTLVENLI
jgi:Mg-chelatase subunit ChlI